MLCRDFSRLEIPIEKERAEVNQLESNRAANQVHFLARM